MNIRQESEALGQAILNAIVCYGEGDNNADILCTLQDEIHSILTANTKVKVWREDDSVQLPRYMKPGDACCDVYAHWVEYKDDRIICHTGLHVELPEEYELQVRPRSSLTNTYLYIPNTPGTVDSGYRGEVLVIFRKVDRCVPFNEEIKIGDRVAQLLIRRVEQIDWVEVEHLEDLIESERGFGGYGSTGK